MFKLGEIRDLLIPKLKIRVSTFRDHGTTETENESQVEQISKVLISDDNKYCINIFQNSYIDFCEHGMKSNF